MRTLTAITLLCGLLGAARGLPAQTVETKVIVNARNPVVALLVDEVSRMFLRRTASWPDGQAVQPVDQEETAAVRLSFTQLIHRRSPAVLESYWQQQIFSGRAVPPPELPSDSEVVEYVRRHPNAIGYVSSGTVLPSGVKTLAVTLR